MVGRYEYVEKRQDASAASEIASPGVDATAGLSCCAETTDTLLPDEDSSIANNALRETPVDKAGDDDNTSEFQPACGNHLDSNALEDCEAGRVRRDAVTTDEAERSANVDQPVTAAESDIPVRTDNSECCMGGSTAAMGHNLGLSHGCPPTEALQADGHNCSDANGLMLTSEMPIAERMSRPDNDAFCHSAVDGEHVSGEPQPASSHSGFETTTTYSDMMQITTTPSFKTTTTHSDMMQTTTTPSFETTTTHSDMMQTTTTPGFETTTTYSDMMQTTTTPSFETTTTHSDMMQTTTTPSFDTTTTHSDMMLSHNSTDNTSSETVTALLPTVEDIEGLFKVISRTN